MYGYLVRKTNVLYTYANEEEAYEQGFFSRLAYDAGKGLVGAASVTGKGLAGAGRT